VAKWTSSATVVVTLLTMPSGLLVPVVLRLYVVTLSIAAQLGKAYWTFLWHWRCSSSSTSSTDPPPERCLWPSRALPSTAHDSAFQYANFHPPRRFVRSEV
jgi:hypothetical protein